MRTSVVLLLLALSPSTAMRLVLQRVKSASVSVDGSVVTSIGKGILALVGLHSKDTTDDLSYCARKLAGAKLWSNENGKTWRKSAKQLEYEVLLVSQFTLYGDVSNKKHCPDFKDSMRSSDGAEEMYGVFRCCSASTSSLLRLTSSLLSLFAPPHLRLIFSFLLL